MEAARLILPEVSPGYPIEAQYLQAFAQAAAIEWRSCRAGDGGL